MYAAASLSASNLHLMAASGLHLPCPAARRSRSGGWKKTAGSAMSMLAALPLLPVILLMWAAWLIDADSATNA